MTNTRKKEVKFIHALLPVIILFATMIYGLGLRPFLFGQEAFSVEMLMVFISLVVGIEMLYLGFSWKEIEASIVRKLAQAIPAFMIILAIGILVGSWMISGVIPMLVSYGIKLVNPTYLYAICLIVPIIFSTSCGTSWGTMSTIGVVLIGVTNAVGGNPAIATAAIVSGAFFGDKMSPLSDTTNLTALACGISVIDHIKSMMYNTIPAMVIALIGYFILGSIYPPSLVGAADTSVLDTTLGALNQLFNFNILLLLPLIVVIIGSVKGAPTVPVMVTSSVSAVVLGLLFQQYTFGNIVKALTSGYNIQMATWVSGELPTSVLTILQRGGIYMLSGTIVVGWTIFFFMGSLELINAIPTVVNKMFFFAKTRFSIIVSSLFTGVFIMATMGHVYAAIFLNSDIFKEKFDKAGISRRVLSRSIEDSGTFFDPIFPWTICGVFVATTFGVPTLSYDKFMILPFVNILLSVIYAYTGFAVFNAKPGEIIEAKLDNKDVVLSE